MSVLEEKVSVSARLPVEPQDTKSIHLIDGMVVVQMTKSGNASTFSKLANKFYAITTPDTSFAVKQASLLFAVTMHLYQHLKLS